MILKLRLDQLLFRKLYKAQKQFQALSKGQSGWRMKQKDPAIKDLFSNLLEARDPITLSALTEEELIAEAGVLIVAGSDTVATALTATLFYCLHYPQILCRLQNEIRSVFADVDEIRSSQRLDSCLYLRACINETMRLSPPVGALLPREILAGGLTVDDHHFPQGVNVFRITLFTTTSFTTQILSCSNQNVGSLALIRIARNLLKRPSLPHNPHFAGCDGCLQTAYRALVQNRGTPSHVKKAEFRPISQY